MTTASAPLCPLVSAPHRPYSNLPPDSAPGNGNLLCTFWNRTPPDRQNQLETRSKRFVTRDWLMDLWGLFGAVSHAEELSHTCLHKCNFFVYVCACVHAFMYTCEHSCVCARACAHTHTQHTGKDQKSKDNFQLSLSQSTQAKVQGQPSALFHLLDEADSCFYSVCSAKSNRHCWTSSWTPCQPEDQLLDFCWLPVSQHAGSSVPLQLEILSSPLELRFDPLLCGAPPGGRYCHCCRMFFFLG